ncbi:MAG: ATP-binding protein [Solirubrobacterales bacterium]|jgi:anti-sigma regulatory factor (Ser/Thr protein kinase)|nr:ATP-binding protein [Solirubrobacterales bacterium]
MTDLPDLELTLPARPENVGVVRHVLGGVAEALDLDHETLDDVRLAVSEACANAVIHAYAGLVPGLMDIDVHAGPRELQISVRDHGAGMAPRTDSPGLGVGLPLMASLAGSMELLSPPGGGTEVRMRFALPAPGPAAARDDHVGPLHEVPVPPDPASHGHEHRR